MLARMCTFLPPLYGCVHISCLVVPGTFLCYTFCSRESFSYENQANVTLNQTNMTLNQANMTLRVRHQLAAVSW